MRLVSRRRLSDKALRDGLIAYDRRHGWRGPHAKIADMSVPWEEEFARIQQRRPLFGPSSWQLAVVTRVEANAATIAGLPDNADGTIPFAEMTWARQSLPNQHVGAAPARPAQVDLNAKNTSLAWGGAESERMDFSGPDKADDIRLNEIVWRSVRGADSPMPAPIRAAFYKAHARDDD